MHILYINGHPRKGSLHSAIEAMYITNITKEHKIRLIRLSDESFDPVLRFGYAENMIEDQFIIESQHLIHWADHIVFAFPIWWGDAPALMKGWIERVFTPGDMYNIKAGKAGRILSGKTADIITTSRMLRGMYWFTGNEALSIFVKNLFILTGIKKQKILTLGGIDFIKKFDTKTKYKKFLQKIKLRAESLK